MQMLSMQRANFEDAELKAVTCNIVMCNAADALASSDTEGTKIL